MLFVGGLQSFPFPAKKLYYPYCDGEDRSVFLSRCLTLPHQFVAVGVEDEGSRPAAFAADFGDLTLAA